MSKFLDEHGLGVLWDKIKTKYATNDTVNGILTGDKPLVNPVIASASW